MKQLLNCILVIDDDEPTNFFTGMIIEESGCTHYIKLVQSGQEALEYLIKSEAGNDANYPTPDLIFLDINMPAMNGWEFLEEYQKVRKTEHEKVIIVMLTTSLFPEDRAKADEIGDISGFENKPLTSENFERIISKYFRGQTV
jgi:CheY-like chemotaxis protein